jgi:hypothetical protein
MSKDAQGELDFGAPLRPAPGRADLRVNPNEGTRLRPIQAEFNRLLQRLEKARAKHHRERTRLDDALKTASLELLPLLAEINQLNLRLVQAGHRALQTSKFSAKRRRWFRDLLSSKASALLADPLGLNEDDSAWLEGVIEEFGPCEEERLASELEAAHFEFMRGLTEDLAREHGINLDLSGLDHRSDPEEFQRLLGERLAQAMSGLPEEPAAPPPAKPARKPSKTRLERERKRLEQEEAKVRDLKSLFKRLAKVLHPDLEPDPVLKEHRETWMKRLNGAYENGDLHDMLQIEMEWLGEEACNLAAAADEKLAVYCTVLKEQIAELRQQTDWLPDDPQYHLLSRFRNPHTGLLVPTLRIKHELIEEINRHQGMLEKLEAGDAGSRRMIENWADDHARASHRPGFHF